MNCSLKSCFPILAMVLLAVPSIAESPDFENDIRPILERSCIGCHGPDKQKSDYRVDIRNIAIRGGGSGKAAIVPHAADDSPLIHYVSREDEDSAMPPANSDAPPLSSAEVALLRAWIDAGPAWPDALAGSTERKPHWSLEPLVRPEVPPGATNPIDAFVHAKLKGQGLPPSPQADMRTLMRRLYYDLIGLPPSPEELDAFESSADPNAYNHLVDELLASPRHGERWARHWLDTIHFADSHGYEHDLARDHAWRYRDYVIESLNADTPWPRFIREQLAADVFFRENTRLTPALGFLGAGTFDLSTYITSTVTFDYLDRDDLVTQTMAAFTGTTANCARCHDHKFDPIPQEDYYALQAVFSGVLKGNVAYDADPRLAQERAKWNNLLSAATERDESILLAPEHDALVRDWLERRGDGATWTPLDVETFLATDGSTLSAAEDGTISASGKRPDKETYTITATSELANITALRLDVFSHDDLPMGGPGRNDNGNFHLSEIELRVFTSGEAEPTIVSFASATSDFDQTDWGILKAIDGNDGTAWGIHPRVGESHHAVFELEAPLTLQEGARLAISLKQLHGGIHLIGAFRLAVTNGPADEAVALPVAALAALALPLEERALEDRVTLATVVLPRIANAALSKLPEQDLVYAAAPAVEIPNGEPAPNYASLDSPKPVHLMIRGDFDKPDKLVAPGALTALENLPERFAIDNPNDEAQRRAALAEWLAHEDNVLTWRCIVNRVWHYHFGIGLCDTPNDLGRMGGTPSHPELLDWLAVWFRDDARGSLKALHRLIVTSDTYKQTSRHRADGATLDKDNRLLWRQNAHRLDADAYRDYAHSVAGNLDLTMGGPGVRHFTEGKGPQITPALDYDAYDWHKAETGHRSIYRFVWRGIADPFMEALDFPDLGLLSPTRDFSASSLQALALYNNEFVLAQSAKLADRVAHEEDTIEEQVARAINLVWLREPTDEETRMLSSYAQSKGMSALCRILLNSNEFLFLD